MSPSSFPAFRQIIDMLEDVTWNKTGRNHEKKHYDGLFNGYHNRKPGDILVLLFSLDTKDRIPSVYEDLLPQPWSEIEESLQQGRTVELEGKSRDFNVILLAVPNRVQLKQLIHDSKFLKASIVCSMA